MGESVYGLSEEEVSQHLDGVRAGFPCTGCDAGQCSLQQRGPFFCSLWDSGLQSREAPHPHPASPLSAILVGWVCWTWGGGRRRRAWKGEVAEPAFAPEQVRTAPRGSSFLPSPLVRDSRRNRIILIRGIGEASRTKLLRRAGDQSLGLRSPPGCGEWKVREEVSLLKEPRSAGQAGAGSCPGVTVAEEEEDARAGAGLGGSRLARGPPVLPPCQAGGVRVGALTEAARGMSGVVTGDWAPDSGR